MDAETIAVNYSARGSGLELGQLERHLQSQLNGRVRHLQIVLHEKGVVLRGVSSTYYGKQLAQHSVMEALNQPILANEIEVT